MKRLIVEFVNLAKLGQSREQAALKLAAFHYAQGRRVLIKAADPLAAERLDRDLWSFEQDSFIPHDQAGGPDEAAEPVLISTSAQNLNRASVLIMLSPVDYGQITGYNHLVYFVPPEDGPELQKSRELYKQLKTQAGIELVHSTRLPD